MKERMIIYPTFIINLGDLNKKFNELLIEVISKSKFECKVWPIHGYVVLCFKVDDGYLKDGKMTSDSLYNLKKSVVGVLPRTQLGFSDKDMWNNGIAIYDTKKVV